MTSSPAFLSNNKIESLEALYFDSHKAKANYFHVSYWTAWLLHKN